MDKEKLIAHIKNYVSENIDADLVLLIDDLEKQYAKDETKDKLQLKVCINLKKMDNEEMVCYMDTSYKLETKYKSEYESIVISQDTLFEHAGIEFESDVLESKIKRKA